jgi:flagellar basal body-associated protein FliL
VIILTVLIVALILGLVGLISWLSTRGAKRDG